MDYFDPLFLKQRGLITTGFHLPYNPDLVERARKMRKHPTAAERILWEKYLRNLKPRFIRQRPIDQFIVDFFCPQLKLVIEVEGSIHDLKVNMIYDEVRELFLNVYNLELLHIQNEDIFNRLNDVCQIIEQKMTQLQSIRN